MAEIRDPRLEIEPVAGEAHRWRVTVRYLILFPRWETGCWVDEAVELRAGTPGSEPDRPPLLRLKNRPWKLDPNGLEPEHADWYRIERSTTPWVVGPQVLDESRDEHVLVFQPHRASIHLADGRMIALPTVTTLRGGVLLNEDTIHARVTVTPCVAQADSADSEAKRGQFGSQP